MYPQNLNLSIDTAYQEAIKQTISSGALDISTEAYNSVLALSVDRASAVSSPHRTDPVTDIYLSAQVQGSYNIYSTPESRPTSSQTRSQHNSQRQSRRSHLTTPTSASRSHHSHSHSHSHHHPQRNSDIIARFQRDSAHIGGVDRSLLSYSALGTPSRRQTNNTGDKHYNQVSKDKVRRHGYQGKASANHRSTSAEKQSARDFLAKLGLTPDNVPSSEYDELLSLLLALKHRNFCELNRVLSLFPYNAALNSMCASLQSNEIRRRLVDILRPGMANASPSIRYTDSPPRKNTRQSKRRPKKQSGPNEEVQTSQMAIDATEISVSSDSRPGRSNLSTPGLDFYLNMAASVLNEPSPTTNSSTQTTQADFSAYLDQSESIGDGSCHQSLQTSTTYAFSAIQDEILSLREMNSKLMQSHDFVVHELDNVTMQLNKEMEKTAKLQALILEKTNNTQEHNGETTKDSSLSLARSSSAPARELVPKHTDLVDRSVSCYPVEQQQQPPLIDSMDQGVQALALSTHSIGTSPHTSFVSTIPALPRRSLSGGEYLNRRSTAEFMSTALSDKSENSEANGIKNNPELKQRSNSVVNMSLLRQDATPHLSTADVALSVLDLSPRSPETTNVELLGSFSSVDSMLDLIASYIGVSSTAFKNQITLSYSLAQLFRIGWYDTPCTHLASVALLDIDLFETGELVIEVPGVVEEFVRESYATSFGSFFVRPYDHSLLTLLLLCIYPAMMFQFAGVVASFMAPVLHDVDKSTADEYSNGCVLFSSLLDLTRAVGGYLEKRNLENLVSSVQSLLQTIKDFSGEIETSCLLPVILALVRIVINRVEQRALVSSLTESMIITDDKIYQIFITILSQILKKITIKIMSDDDEESPITPEQQIALRMVRLAVQTLAPLKQTAI